MFQKDKRLKPDLIDREILENALKKISEEIEAMTHHLQALKIKKDSLLILLSSDPTSLSLSGSLFLPGDRVPSRLIRKMTKDFLVGKGPSSASTIARYLLSEGVPLGDNRPDIKVWSALRGNKDFYIIDRLWHFKGERPGDTEPR